ncbi:MATE family efflux transporter [Hydrogenophaga sp.]|uniref:MATE family efflux transporter n=1 Tax=Hydrogenophaga sp. TaxID=1904254 RepID=UPI0026388D95|nr:MATE family efflux transporter [Hydrogenophaga sp.]MCW5653525.1 MATE family efflux transporter [Hydrogenophaga sp.]
MTTPADRPLPMRFLWFLGPLILSNVLQALGGTLNNVYLGQMLGARAMAAAVSFFPVHMFLLAFVIGLGTGASILVGQARGAGDLDKARQVAGAVIWGGLLLGIAVAAIGGVTAAWLVRWLGTPAEIEGDAVRYASVLMAGLPIFFTSMLAAAVLRGMGDTVTPLRMLVVSCLVSAALTPALIRGWLGLPKLGVSSAAWAQLAATLLALAWLTWHLRRSGHGLALHLLRAHLRPHAPVLRNVVRLGIPTGLFFVTGSLADMALLSLVNRHGVHATAAWGAVNQVIAYVLFPAMSIAIAASVFAAQAIGAGRREDVGRVARVGLLMNLALTGSLALLVALLAPFVVSLFVKDAAVIDLAAQVLRLSVWGSILFGLASVFSGVMRAAGTVRVPTAISLGCLALLLYPLGRLLGGAFGLPFVWLAYPLTYACALLLQAGYYHRIWRRRPIAKLV